MKTNTRENQARKLAAKHGPGGGKSHRLFQGWRQKWHLCRQGDAEMDKRILETILYKFSGGPVGVNSLAVAVGEETGTIEEVYEPYLIQEGYLQRTPQGRVATQRCHELFGQDSGTAQKELF